MAVTWTQIHEGGLGWVMWCAASRDGARIMSGTDVCQSYEKYLDDSVEWTALAVPGNVPSALIGGAGTNGRPGFVDGSIGGGYGGAGHDVRYFAMTDCVLVSTDDAPFTRSAITGLPINSNGGGARYFGPKIATHPTDEDICFAGMGPGGLRYTDDRGVTMKTPTGITTPNAPATEEWRWTLVALDEATPANIYASPSGRGIWRSTNGGVSFTDITASSGITGAVCMVVINGTLWVTAANTTAPDAMTNNLWSWTSGGGWVNFNASVTGLSGITLSLYAWKFITPDARYTNGFWLTGDQLMVHTVNGTDFTGIVSNYAQPRIQVKPRTRSLMANKTRFTVGGASYSLPVVAGPYLYLPGGLGPQRTLVADWPLVTVDETLPYDPDLPTWEEDVGGEYEELVGQCAGWLYDDDAGKWNGILGGQDVAIQLMEDGTNGHVSTVTYYPHAATLPDALSDGHSVSRGPDPSHGVVHRSRQEQLPVPGICFTLTAGRDWQNCDNQPNVPSFPYAAGQAVLGEDGKIIAFQSTTEGGDGSYPQYVSDLGSGSNMWADLVFRNQSNVVIDLTVTAYHGFHGASFDVCHHPAVYDPATGDWYCVNIGAGAAGTWEADPLGYGGIYRMAANEWGTFRRIYTGNPGNTGNYGLYDCTLLLWGRDLLFMPNNLPQDPFNTSNKVAVYNLDSSTKTTINDVVNCQSITLGMNQAGNGETLWLQGYSTGGTYGIWEKTSLAATPSGPHDYIPVGGGFIRYLVASPGQYGVFIGAVNSRGHVLGRLQ